MNLRKALDKAKQMRGENPPRPLTAGKPVVITRSPDRDWKPPEYTESCSMHVESATLMENRCVCIEPDADELKAYKVLRTRIQQATKRKAGTPS